jgi:hypothetical protein
MNDIEKGLGKLFDQSAKHILENQKLREEVSRLNLQNNDLKNILRRMVAALRDLDPLRAAENYLEAIEKRNHVCQKCGAIQPPMCPQTFGVCQKCGEAFHYTLPE